MTNKLIKDIKKIVNNGLLHILTGSFLAKAITMLSTILIVRLVSKELYAYYSYTTNLYSYIDLINGLELSGALLIFCSRSKNNDSNSAWLKYSVKISFFIQLILSILLCFIITFGSIAYPQAKKFFYFYILLPAGTAIINCIQSFVRAYGQNKLYSKISVIRAITIALLSLVLVPIISINGLIIALYFGALIAIGIGGKYCFLIVKNSKKITLTKEEKKHFYILAFSFLVANGFSILIPLNETLLVNEIISNEIITANFKVAGLIPQQLTLITGSICIYFYPEIAKTRNYKKAWNKITKIGVYTAGIIILTSIIGIIVSPLVIKILYGNKYLDAIYISNVLWIMRGIDCSLRIIPITFLPALGDTKFNYIASPIFSLIHIIIDYFMIKNLGINGIALATIISYTLWGSCAWLYLKGYCQKKESLYVE